MKVKLTKHPYIGFAVVVGYSWVFDCYRIALRFWRYGFSVLTKG